MRIVVTGAAGYLGSALVEVLRGWRNTRDLIGVDWAPHPGNWISDYQNALTMRELAAADAVIHLAAHSSVKACQADPERAWANNVTAFEALLRRFSPNTTLIYASSASVYHGLPGAATEDAALLPPVALYDATKRTMDDLARLSGLRAYGLRFGTICGPSPQMRPELLLNAMTRSAVEHGYVRVQNPQARRSVLGIDDAVGAILHLLDGDAPPGVYNVASERATIEAFGQQVAALCDVPLIIDPTPTPCYDFYVSTAKLEATGWAPRQSAAGIVRALLEGAYANT